MSRISEIADTMATGQRCYVEKDSTAPRKDHPTNVMLLRSAAQGADSVRSPTTKAPQELDINFLILNDGKELRGTLQNTGGAVQYDLMRMKSSECLSLTCVRNASWSISLVCP